MNNIHFSIETRGGYVYANGKIKISIRLFIGRFSRRYLIPTAEVRPEYWDKSRLRVKNRTPDYANINKHILLYEQRANEIIRKYDRHRKILTFDLFGSELYNKDYEPESQMLKMKFEAHLRRKGAMSLEAFILLDRYFHTEDLTKAQRNGLGAYLFACCCGMRYSDIQKITFRNFKGTNLVITGGKTGKSQNIEIIAPAFDYIDKRNKISRYHNVFCLSPTSASPTNKILKEIAKKINEREKNEIVPPDIHFQTSRYFFDNELMKVTDAETAAEITGHSIKNGLIH
jgi:hypothetical protein